jgi:hypothetical protein
MTGNRDHDRKSVRSKIGAVVGGDRLRWRTTENGAALYHGQRKRPLALIEPDAEWEGMYRVRLPDGRLSDMVNLTRAKDAALSIALQALNSGPQERAQEHSLCANAGARYLGSSPTPIAYTALLTAFLRRAAHEHH